MLPMQKKQSKKQGEQGRQGERFISLLPCLIALCSGILMGLTVAPVGAWFLAWIALAPLWVLVVGSTTQAKLLPLLPLASRLSPLLWGIGYHGVAISWIVGIH